MIHSEYDVESEDNGDLVLENGDFKTATASRSVMQALSFVMLTDYGEYTPQPLTGANLGSFIGKNNTPSTRSKMRSSIKFGLSEQGAVSPDQILLNVVPVDVDKALAILKLGAIFVEKEVADVLTESLVAGFAIPYLSGTVTKVVLPNES